MHLNVIENGKIVKGVYCDRGTIIHHAIAIDDDTFLFSGDIKNVEERISAMKGLSKALTLNIGVVFEKIKVLPLYKRLSSEDCVSIINMAHNYTGTGFLRELSEVFYSDDLYDWLESEKESKLCTK